MFNQILQGGFNTGDVPWSDAFLPIDTETLEVAPSVIGRDIPGELPPFRGNGFIKLFGIGAAVIGAHDLHHSNDTLPLLLRESRLLLNIGSHRRKCLELERGETCGVKDGRRKGDASGYKSAEHLVGL